MRSNRAAGRCLLLTGMALGILADPARADVLVSPSLSGAKGTNGPFTSYESQAPSPAPLRTPRPRRVVRSDETRDALVRRYGVTLATLIFGYYSWIPQPHATPLGTTPAPVSTPTVPATPPPQVQVFVPPPPATFYHPPGRPTIGMTAPPGRGVPEPATLVSALLGAGLVGGLGLRKRLSVSRQRNAARNAQTSDG